VATGVGHKRAAFGPQEDTVSDPFLGEIKMWAYSWAPQGWALCDGAILNITQYQALASLIYNYFGGDGRTTFALPDLRGRTPIGIGTSPGGKAYKLGTQAGAETVALSINSVLPHTHSVNAYAVPGNASSPAGADLAAPVPPASGATASFAVYLPNATSPTVPSPAVLAGGTVGVAGASAGHNNMQPFTVVNFCIAVAGTYPPRP
jgi:microcystin-dependent protein